MQSTSHAKEELQSHGASFRFNRAGLLNYDEPLLDGFRANFVGEQLLVDAERDGALRNFVAFTRGCLPPEGSSGESAHLQVIAKALATALGGVSITQSEMEERYAQRRKELRLGPLDALAIGALFGRGGERGAGQPYHRAVLFKYLCDALGVCKTALVDTAKHPSVKHRTGLVNLVLVDSSSSAVELLLGAELGALEEDGEMHRMLQADAKHRLGARAARGRWHQLPAEPQPAAAGGVAGFRPTRPPPPPLSEALSAQIRQLALELGGVDFQYVSHRPLEADRREILAGTFDEVLTAQHVVAVLAQQSGGGAPRELIATASKGEPPAVQLVATECQITFDDLSPSDCVEFAFAEAPSTWAAAKLSLDGLEGYRSSKFESWKDLLINGTCEAQLRRMVQIGLVTDIFDNEIFPTPDSMKHLYEVIDERNGNLIKLPHPVSGLRIWNAAELHYDSIDPHLSGAPGPSESDEVWRDLVTELRRKYGGEFIDGLMGEKALKFDSDFV